MSIAHTEPRSALATAERSPHLERERATTPGSTMWLAKSLAFSTFDPISRHVGVFGPWWLRPDPSHSGSSHG